MAGYKVFFKDSVEKDFRSIPKHAIMKILERIESLVTNPHSPGCEKLSGQEKYRIRQGNYRIIYSVQDKLLTIWIVKIGHRKDVYR